MKKSTSASLLALATALSGACATPTRFPIKRAVSPGARISANTGPVPSYSVSAAGGAGGIANVNDNLYTVDLTICGQVITVQLDTGSTDLWVAPPTPLTGVKDTKLTSTFTYGIGDVTGDISLCPVSFGQYTIAQQAFLSATSAHFDNLFSLKTYGIIGLGFDSLSDINEKAQAADGPNGTWGRSVLTNLFYANPKTPNFISFLLDRASDLDTVSQGSFTVGETEPAYADVIKQPPLAAFPDDNVRRWAVVMDGLYVNGKSVPITSIVNGAPAGKNIAILDTGASLVLGPKAGVDAIYSAIPGSYFDSADNLWIVPCTSTVDVVFTFAGIDYPIHYLDLTSVVTVQFTDGTSGTFCINSIRENTLTAGAGEFDWLMGDTFQRNVYSMFDFGDLDTSTGGLVGHPFVKLLPLPGSAHTVAAAEFKTARTAALAKLPPVSDPKILAGLSSDDSTSSSANPQSLASDASGGSVDSATLVELQDDMSKVLKYIPYILGLLGASVLIMILLLLASCVSLFKLRGKSSYQPVKTHGY